MTVTPTMHARALVGFTALLLWLAPAHGDNTMVALLDLRALLQQVRAAPAPERMGVITLPDVRALAGTSRAQLVRMLAEPDNCKDKTPAACESLEVWTYAFYKRPPQAAGGGPELTIRFAANGNVQHARWQLPQ